MASEFIKYQRGSQMISKSTLYKHIHIQHNIDDDILNQIKHCWHNGRWHYNSMLVVEDIAYILRISTRTVYRLLKSKQLKSVKIGHQYFIKKEDLIDFENERRS
ncbi:MAG: helix-turn-helix domain-containing protein [Candidatus Micrarchaeaceae archaeon]